MHILHRPKRKRQSLSCREHKSWSELIFESLGGLVTRITEYLCAAPSTLVARSLPMDYNRHVNASFAEICPHSWPKGVYYGSTRVDLWAYFWGSGRAGDINNSTSTPNYWDEPYGGLDIYVNKDPSAWTEVSIATCPPTASITAPGGRDLGDFWASGRVGDM